MSTLAPRRLLRRTRWLAAVGIVAVVAVAWASKTRLRLERIDATDFSSDSKISAYVSMVELEGTVEEDRPANAFTLLINGKPSGKPEKMARFQGSKEPLDLVLVVETSALYGPQKAAPPPPPAPPKGKGAKPAKPGKSPKGKPTAPAPAPKPAPAAKGAAAAGAKGKKKRALAPAPAPGVAHVHEEPLEKVKDALKSLLEPMPPSWRVLVVDYGGDINAHMPFRNAGSASNTVDDLSTDEESGDLRLVEAVKAALHQLEQPRPDEKTARRVIAVISDGLNSQMDRKTFRALGEQAKKAHIPIHSIAYSPMDDRGPLLNLGEVSKLSNGTFRWAKTADDIKNQLETLGDELNKQYILTYNVKLTSLEHQVFAIQCEDLVSNDFSFSPRDKAAVTRLPWWWWLLIIGGPLAFIGFVVWFVRRIRAAAADGAPRGKKASKAPKKGAAAKAPPAQQQAAAQPSHAAPAGAYSRGELYIIDGALQGQRFPVTATAMVIGKFGTIAIADDPTVSTTHAQIYFANGAFVLQDLGSTNGTFVNNQRVTQPVALRSGDLVRFGNTQVKFRAE